MIYRLRKKFIGICIASFAAVFAVVIALIFLITSLQTDRTLDRHTDMISQHDGRFPDFSEINPDTERPRPPDGFNKESPFTTRYFTVRFNSSGESVFTDVRQVAGVSEDEANAYARSAIGKNRERGWIDDYRYKVYSTADGVCAVFVSGAAAKENNRSFMLGTLSVFSLCSIIIIILIIFISKKAVKPAAESYEKQKQFITNANHELKTPLTLINANLDILEAENGENEWLSDIREESVHLNELVNRMVMLARMDEEGSEIEFKKFNLAAAVDAQCSTFIPTARSRGLNLLLDIGEDIFFEGDETGIRQAVSVLMDNAMKYCDTGGTVTVRLTADRHPILTVENSYSAVQSIELKRLFDRFYRADKARTYGGGFGIGLSIAKAIVEKHHGSISAYNAENSRIGFKIKL